LAPAFSARGWVGTRTLLDLGTFAAVQRFVNNQSRLVYAQTVYASVFRDLGGGLRGRLSTTLGYLDDSEIETARRLGATGELGAVLVRPRWSAEVWTGGGSRTYPNLTVQERLERSATYDEQTWSVGTTLRYTAGKRFGIRADGVRQSTDSPDPLFDSGSWVVIANADVGLAASLFLTARGTYQERKFDSRPQGEDRDEYWQAGVGLRYSLTPGWAVSARWGYSEYAWPDGTLENSHRFVAGIERAWGRPGVAPLPSVDVGALTRAGGGSIQEMGADGRVCFRVSAAGAERVSVAGSFNDWDPEATPLRPAGDGRWEGCAELEPGTYQYAYIIDGEWTTPPEAKSVVEDGFGGRNGILEVLPEDM
jgi:opacity protein-like surface antigen